MASHNHDSWTDSLNEAIAAAASLSASTAQAVSDALQVAADSLYGTTASVGYSVNKVVPTVHEWVEQGTSTVGRVVTPIVDNPMIKSATHIPMIKWLLAAVGQVNIERVQQDVAQLRQTYPLEPSEQIAHRIIVDTALKAAGIGLVTNFIPQAALGLMAIDVAAVTALQAEMIYRIAAVYGFPLEDPTRRGEVLAIWALSVGGTGLLKTGMSSVELVPVLGPVVGVTGNAALLYSLGYAASRFYETKQQARVGG